MNEAHDASEGTVGWFALGTGTVGITKGETLRLSVVNTGSVNVNIVCGIWQNPRLAHDSYTLQPGQSRHCDVNLGGHPKPATDGHLKTGHHA